MRRWSLVALTPAILVIGHYAGVLAVEEIKGSADNYFALVMFLAEVIGGPAIGYWLARSGSLPRHARWSLPFAIAAGFLPWLFLATMGTFRLGALLPSLIIWAFTVAALGLVVGALRDRLLPVAVLVAVLAAGALLVLLPYLGARSELGSTVAPLSNAANWAIQSAIHPDGYGATAVQRLASGYASALAMLVILGTTVYLGSLFGSRTDPHAVRSDASPTPVLGGHPAADAKVATG